MTLHTLDGTGGPTPSELYESNVRSYGRRFPAVFARASACPSP